MNITPIKFGEIKYFHPSGRTTLPNGHPIQKGGFIRECSVNRNSFERPLYSDHCIVIPTNSPEITHDDIRAVIEDYMADSPVTYTIGNYFKGRYIVGSGEIFNDNSIAIGIDGLPEKTLEMLIARLSERLALETLLIKDFTNNKIFIACP